MHTFKSIIFVSALTIFIGLVLDGCKKEDNPAAPAETVEHPPATTVYFIVTQLDNSGNPTTIKDTCVVRDTTQTSNKKFVDGVLNLSVSKAYAGTFELYDETKTPAENLNADIISEKDAHLFKFQPTGGIDTNHVKISNLDLDSNGKPFGLNFKIAVTAGGAATGVIHVQLEHHDDGNKDGTVFDLDLDRDFPVTIVP
jgi:hypothetical protein